MDNRFTFDGRDDISIHVTNYMDTNFAIDLDCDEGGCGTLTINLSVPLGLYQAFVDTNNMRDAEQFIKDNNLGEKIGELGAGWCVYPLYQFNKDVLAQITPKECAEYEEFVNSPIDFSLEEDEFEEDER